MQPETRPMRRGALWLALLLAAGCQQAGGAGSAAPGASGGRLAQAPPGAPENSCWARDASPAVVETVTEQIIVAPEEVNAAGEVIRPAVYRTETRQQIVKAREDIAFEVPCAGQMTPEFIASLQRALQARGLYQGPVSGRMDARTRSAIRLYQKPLGLDSGMLSLSAARSLGLVALEREE